MWDRSCPQSSLLVRSGPLARSPHNQFSRRVDSRSSVDFGCVRSRPGVGNEAPYCVACWRVGVIACGFLYSVILFHQQVLTDQVNEKTNQKLLSDAIASANSHADQQFGTVRANVENLGKEVEGVGKALDEKTAAINAALSAATGSINTNLGKVGKPVPIPPPRIEFTLADVPGSAIPVREEVISQTPTEHFHLSST